MTRLACGYPRERRSAINTTLVTHVSSYCSACENYCIRLDAGAARVVCGVTVREKLSKCRGCIAPQDTSRGAEPVRHGRDALRGRL